ncbi:protein TWIN LOV 1 [Capsicum galapagoense]
MGDHFGCSFICVLFFDEKDGRLIHLLGFQVSILRRPKPSRVGLNLCQDGAGCRESVLRCYIREVYSMSMEWELPVTLGSSLEFTGVDVEGPCVASDLEKRKATTVVKKILTVLRHNGESTGRLVGGKRLSPSGMGLLGPSLNISFFRIKQSFILTDANLPVMSIVFASDTFLKLTGFSKDEVLGYNCRSLSVINTDSSSQFWNASRMNNHVQYACITEKTEPHFGFTFHLYGMLQERLRNWRLAHWSLLAV